MQCPMCEEEVDRLYEGNDPYIEEIQNEEVEIVCSYKCLELICDEI